MQTFGSKLREIRERTGQTQEHLARASGVNVWTIRGYEQGKREPNWKQAILLARALGVAVEEFAECVSQADNDTKAQSQRRPPRRQGPRKSPGAGENQRPPVQLPARHDIPLSPPADGSAGRRPGVRSRKKK